MVFVPLELKTTTRTFLNDLAGSAADLDKAQRIAERGGMYLHLADVHLHRGRLFSDKTEIVKARAIIEKCGYRRRRARRM